MMEHFKARKVRGISHALVTCLALLTIDAGTVSADDHSASRPVDHAPIGVMGDHVHKKGEIMLSYRDMKMVMDGNRDGTNHVSTQGVFDQGFMVAPTRMRMDMHMIGLMYGLTDRVTAMVMVPWIDLSMDHKTRSGGNFTTRSNGIGDVGVSGLISVFEGKRSDVTLQLGISLPSGSINQHDNTPMGRQRLPYPMQLGSGTYDIISGLTYQNRGPSLAFGAQVTGLVRTGENDNDYSLGDRMTVSTWTSWEWARWISTSLRLRGEGWGDINGADPTLNPAMVPTARTDLRGGQRADLIFGINTLGHNGIVAGHRLAVEFALPVYQDLDGPQLETDWGFTLGWQRAFN